MDSARKADGLAETYVKIAKWKLENVSSKFLVSFSCRFVAGEQLLLLIFKI